MSARRASSVRSTEVFMGGFVMIPKDLLLCVSGRFKPLLVHMS
jgi:hypothetical protein